MRLLLTTLLLLALALLLWASESLFPGSSEAIPSSRAAAAVSLPREANRPVANPKTPLKALDPVHPVRSGPARTELVMVSIDVARTYPNGHLGARGRASVREGAIELVNDRSEPLGRTPVQPDGSWVFLSKEPVSTPLEVRAIHANSGTVSAAIAPH